MRMVEHVDAAAGRSYEFTSFFFINSSALERKEQVLD